MLCFLWLIEKERANYIYNFNVAQVSGGCKLVKFNIYGNSGAWACDFFLMVMVC